MQVLSCVLYVLLRKCSGLNQCQCTLPVPSLQEEDEALDGWALRPLSPAGHVKVALQVSAVPPEHPAVNSMLSKPSAWSQHTLHSSSLYRAEVLPRRHLGRSRFHFPTWK